MNILLVYKEADIATYKMLEGLSKLEDFNIYIASPQSYTDKKIYGNCTPLDLPVITSKFNWNVIRALRRWLPALCVTAVCRSDRPTFPWRARPSR